MSRRTRDFSFLSQMEPCTYSKEVVELGRQIVEELKLKGEGDTLGRWICRPPHS